ncbi:MAG: cell division protein ZapB [Thermoanaerobaculia bacterium]
MKKSRDNEQLSLGSTEEGEILNRLGDRVEKAVAAIQTLRRERDELRARLEKIEKDLVVQESAAEKLEELESENERFRNERDEIKNRIERILANLERIDEESVEE